MKKYIKIFVPCIVALLFSSCLSEPAFSRLDLIGKWQRVDTEEFYRYKSDGTGKFWNEADDVHESDITDGGNGSFEWELNGSKLTLILNNEMGTAVVPKNYTVTTLDETDLVYLDINTAGGKETVKLKRVN